MKALTQIADALVVISDAHAALSKGFDALANAVEELNGAGFVGHAAKVESSTETEQAASEQAASEQAEKPKRGRGRPPKAASEQAASEQAEKPKRGRGRPPKAAKPEPEETVDDEISLADVQALAKKFVHAHGVDDARTILRAYNIGRVSDADPADLPSIAADFRAGLEAA